MQHQPNPHTALVLIDIQDGFHSPQWGTHNNPEAEMRAACLLERWRALGWPVVHIQHLSEDKNSPLYKENQAGVQFQAVVMPHENETVLTKSVNSAFIGTGLEAYLRERGITSLVIAGLTTDHCISTSTRMAGNLGFDVWLVGDATATFDKTDAQGRHFDADTLYAAHLASLHREFAEVVTSGAARIKLPDAYFF